MYWFEHIFWKNVMLFVVVVVGVNANMWTYAVCDLNMIVHMVVILHMHACENVCV